MLGRKKRAVQPVEVPFGIEAPDKIDFVALPPDGASVDLHIAQNVEWDGSDRVIALLQEKIHNYVGFAADGQLAAAYPDQAELPWRIVVDCQTPPDPRTAQVLDALVEPVGRYGGTLVWRNLDQ